MAYRMDRRTVSIDEARGMLAVHGEPIARVERLALDAAAGRVVARDVYAAFDIPPFARAVMDGYAVKAIDTDGASRDTPVHLTLVESIFTGSVPTRAIELGECAGIATGAPMPKGADSVVMVEQSRLDGSHVLIFESSRPGQHVAVGHRTVWRDEPGPPTGRGIARTGVTAIVPFGADELFEAQVPAGAAVLNGAGEAIGITTIQEWGIIESPILLTSSMAIGRVYDGAIERLVAQDSPRRDRGRADAGRRGVRRR